MKKLLAVILSIVLLLPVFALADLPDLSTMSDQEIKDLIAACSQELMARNTSEPEGILIFEYEGVRVYQIDEPYFSGPFIYIPVAVYNDMDHEMVISAENVICNGWDIWGGSCRASGKAKKKDNLSFKTEDADVKSVDQIDSLKFSWQVYDYDDLKKLYTQDTAEEHRFW